VAAGERSKEEEHMPDSIAPENRSAILQWVIVLGVGALVVTVVLALNLIPRLNDGQKVLNAAKPAFASQRLQADVAGINIISHNVDMADPIVTSQGGGAAEIPAVVAYVAKTEHISSAKALALMSTTFPHTTALLGALPLSSVTAELPKLLAFLSTTLKVTPAQLAAALKTNFPALTQAITNLPTVTNGWEHIQGIDGLTRFDGTPVSSVPDLRDYFNDDLIPAVAAQQKNFQSLDDTSSVNWIAPLLLIIGIVVILFAAVMIVRNLRGIGRREQVATAAVVPIVGVVVVGLVLAISLIPRVGNGQKLLNGLAPAFTKQRVIGDRAGINMVSAIIATENPIMTTAGGGAAEVPKLIAFVSSKTGLSQAQVLAALQKNFPHVTALLEAIPLSAVTAELPKLTAFLAPAVPAVPRLAQTITAAPLVTNGWDNVPGTAGTTLFNGAPIKTVPDIGTYFSSDVIPVLERQRLDYDRLVATSNIDFLGPLVLIVGIIVIIYGLLMVRLAWLGDGAPEPTPEPEPARRLTPVPAG
jgi:multisubunit Na+/H+ antiporter MnhB subunit